MSEPEVVVVAAQVLAEEAAQRVAALLRRAQGTGPGLVSLGLAGGSTPRALHARLAAAEGIDWERVAIYFGDERCVAPDHPESNYRMARESLFDRVPIPGAQVHRMQGEATDRDAAARAYEATLPRSLDVLILGIGEDGHTASLFPGSSAVFEAERLVLPVVGPKPPPERLSITPRVISSAREVVVLASGAGKKDAVGRALQGDWDPGRTPAQIARRGLWVLDHEAAALVR